MDEFKKRIVPTIDPCRVLSLGWGVFLFSMVYFFAVTFIPIPETGEDNAKYIVGFLVGTGVGSIISFYFRRNTDTDPTKNLQRESDKEIKEDKPKDTN